MIINIADRRSISNYRLHDLIGAWVGYTLHNLLVMARADNRKTVKLGN